MAVGEHGRILLSEINYLIPRLHEKGPRKEEKDIARKRRATSRPMNFDSSE